jgi:hypothetical protein
MMRADMPVQKFRSIEEMNQAPVVELRSSDFERFLPLRPLLGDRAEALPPGRVQVPQHRRGAARARQECLSGLEVRNCTNEPR